MKTATLHAVPSRATAIMVTRWMHLIEVHGSPAEALEALLRDSDQLHQLQQAVRSCGIDPEQLLRDVGPRPR